MNTIGMWSLRGVRAALEGGGDTDGRGVGAGPMWTMGGSGVGVEGTMGGSGVGVEGTMGRRVRGLRGWMTMDAGGGTMAVGDVKEVEVDV